VQNSATSSSGNVIDGIASASISRIDLIIRWGGGRRLSGFLPIQSVYADLYVVDEMWPDYRSEQVYKALEWYQDQDMTLGG
jgi:undecaprenyl diphosphate synthase